jgi:hypothetical protein
MMDSPLSAPVRDGIDNHRKFTRALVTVLGINTPAARQASISPTYEELYAFLTRNNWQWNGKDWIFVDFC